MSTLLLNLKTSHWFEATIVTVALLAIILFILTGLVGTSAYLKISELIKKLTTTITSRF